MLRVMTQVVCGKRLNSTTLLIVRSNPIVIVIIVFVETGHKLSSFLVIIAVNLHTEIAGNVIIYDKACRDQ